MSIKNNLLLTIFLFSFIFLGMIGLNYFNTIQEETYRIFPYILFEGILFIPAGLIIGIPKVLCEIKKDGIWNFNFVNFLIIAVPTSLLMIYPLLHYYIKLPSILSSSILGTSPYPIFGFIFGYLLISNWEKVNSS